jgi:hypothetical protein
MKLEISNKMLTFAIIGLVAVIVLALVINRYRSRSKFEWPVPDADVKQDDTNLAKDLQSYQDTFNLAMIGVNAMPAGDAKTAAIMAAETTLSTSINNRVGRYVSDKCPAVTSGSKPIDTGDATVDAANTAAWNAYQSDLAKIQQAYYTVVGAATPTSTPPSEQVLAARKADISGATRKYIATVCPKFYKTTSTDPTADYKKWNYVETGTPTETIGLSKADVTAANVTTWAGYAAKTKSTTSSVTVLPGATGSVDLPALAVADTTGFAVGDSVQFTYQVVSKDTGATTTSAPVMGTIKSFAAAPIGIVITVTSVPATGYVVPSGTVIAKAMVTASTTWNKLDAAGVPNWKKARDYGPGSYPKPTWGTV